MLVATTHRLTRVGRLCLWLAAAASDGDIAAVIDELVDRYGPPPEPARRLIAVARLRLLCREYGITEIAATATGVKVSPLVLPDSAQVRLARMYPAANYRATTSTVQVPIPRDGDGVGAPRIRDLPLVQWVVDLVAALAGRPPGEIDITALCTHADTQSGGSR